MEEVWSGAKEQGEGPGDKEKVRATSLEEVAEAATRC